MGAASTKEDDDARRAAQSDVDEARLLARLRGTELEWVPTADGGWWSQHASLVHIQACIVPMTETLLVAQRFIEALERDPHQQHFTPQRQVELGLEMFRSVHDRPHPLGQYQARLPAQWRDEPRLRVLLLYYGYVAHVVCDTVLRLLACVRRGYSPLPTTTLLDQMRVIVRDIPLPYPLGHILLTEALTLSRLARRQHGNPDELVLVLAAWHWTPLEAYAFGPHFRNVSRDADPMNAAFDFGGVPDDDTMAARPPEHLDLILVELAKDARRRVPLPEERRENEDDVLHMPAPPSPEQESMTLAQWATHWLKLGGQLGTKLAIDINDKMLVHLGLVFLAFHCLPRASASFDTENWLGWTNRTDVDLTDFFPNGPNPAQFAAWPGLRERLEDDLSHGPGGARDLLYTGEVNCVWSPDGLEKHAYDEVAVYCTHVARVAFLSMAGAMTPHFCAQNSRDIAIFVTSMLDEVKKQIPGAILVLRSKLISGEGYEGWKTHLRSRGVTNDRGQPIQRLEGGKVMLSNGQVVNGDAYSFDEVSQRWVLTQPNPANRVVPPDEDTYDATWSDTAHQYVKHNQRAEAETYMRGLDAQADARARKLHDQDWGHMEDDYEVAPLREKWRKVWLEYYHGNTTPERNKELQAEEKRLAERLEDARERWRTRVRLIRQGQARRAPARDTFAADLRGHMRETEPDRHARMRAVRGRRPPSPPPRLPRDTPGAAAGAGPVPMEQPPPAGNNGWFSFWF